MFGEANGTGYQDDSGTRDGSIRKDLRGASSSAKRQTAIKSWISDIANGRYIKVEGEWEPNYVLTPRNVRVSRANLIGIVVSEPDIDPGHYSFAVDDGSGRITVRSFDSGPPKKIGVGDIITIIGRPREFGSEVYVMPEIIAKVRNPAWLSHRKAELGLLYSDMPQVLGNPKPESGMSYAAAEKESESRSQPARTGSGDHTQTHDQVYDRVYEEVVIEDVPKTALQAEQVQTAGLDPINPVNETGKKNPIDSILEIIRKLDTGSGTDTEEAVSMSGIERSRADAIISDLLMNGEIFEIRPGRLKVME